MNLESLKTTIISKMYLLYKPFNDFQKYNNIQLTNLKEHCVFMEPNDNRFSSGVKVSFFRLEI